MDFQIASDLHIDTHGGLNAPASCFPIRKAPILLLCGDVYPFAKPEYPEILKRVAEPFEMVMYVPGNHEYYDSSYSIDPVIEEACFSLGNVVFMNKRSVNIREMQFIGATLWTNNPTDESARRTMNDYAFIHNMTPRRSHDIHKEHREFIVQSVKSAKQEGRVGAVVMTHHVPDNRLAFDITSRSPDVFPFYFSSDMQGVTNDGFIKVWAHGHSHEAYRTKLASTGPIFASNALGYPGEKTGYSRNAVMRLWGKS